MPGLDLAGVYAKIDRAREHREALCREVRTWLDSKPYEFVLKSEFENTQHTWLLAKFNKPDRMRWALIVGDALHNLRCALDHLFWVAAERHAVGRIDVTEAERKQRQFPIAETAGQFERARDAKFNLVSQAVWAAIERDQPYKREDRRVGFSYVMLNSLSNADKHRAVRVITAATRRLQIGTMLGKSAGMQVGLRIDTEFLAGRVDRETGAEVFSVTFPETGHDVNPHFATSVEVLIAEERCDWIDATEFIRLLADDVRGVVERVASTVT